MYNEHTRTLQLTRSEMLRIHQAVTSVKWDFLNELHNSKNPIDDDRKRSLQGSADMWDAIGKKIEAQFDEQEAADPFVSE